MILNTTFVIDFLRNQKDAVTKADHLRNTGEPLFITTITVYELWGGIEEVSEKARKLLEMFQAFGALVFDMESAKKAGTIRRVLGKRGTPIDVENVMIAAIAIERNETLLTRNIRQFSRIEGLKVESY
ncbi:MAG: PIN domain-containing protein [Candidatus Aenigmarchaeota archaeon]|nr:PIN domain-containing protein [Candidatus Aenigmarchaeota archaeon]